MESKSIGFSSFFFSGLVETTIYISRGTVRRKTTTRKTYYGLIILGQKAKNFWPSGNCFSIELSKLRANIYVEKFEAKMKKSTFSSFLVFERKVFGLLLISLLVFVKIAFYLSVGLVWINCFFLNKKSVFYHIRTKSEQFWRFLGTF